MSQRIRVCVASVSTRLVMVQITRDDIYSMQSQLPDRGSRVGIESALTSELETKEPKPLRPFRYPLSLNPGSVLCSYSTRSHTHIYHY